MNSNWLSHINFTCLSYKKVFSKRSPRTVLAVNVSSVLSIVCTPVNDHTKKRTVLLALPDVIKQWHLAGYKWLKPNVINDL